MTRRMIPWLWFGLAVWAVGCRPQLRDEAAPANETSNETRHAAASSPGAGQALASGGAPLQHTPTRETGDLVTLGDIPWSALAGKPVLVVTHPTLPIVKTFEILVRNKLLNVPGLFVLGLYHDQEQGTYKAARKYAAEKQLGWFGFRRMTCPLKPKQVFAPNPCSQTFRTVARYATALVFTGGPDMPPALYGEPTLLTTAIRDPHRHYWEVSLLFHLLGSSRRPAQRPLLAKRPNTPVLAICLGMQHLNVATGGTLIQDIPSEIYGVSSQEEVLKLGADQRHRNAHWALRPQRGMTSGVVHGIRWTGPKQLWGEIMATHPAKVTAPVKVFSVHHQAVEKLGRGLQVVATSTDGKVVEGLIHQRYPAVLAVQFHPEHRSIWSPSIKARLSPGAPIRNIAKSALANDKRSRAFHTGLWRLFSRWLQAEHQRRHRMETVPKKPKKS